MDILNPKSMFWGLIRAPHSDGRRLRSCRGRGGGGAQPRAGAAHHRHRPVRSTLVGTYKPCTYKLHCARS